MTRRAGVISITVNWLDYLNGVFTLIMKFAFCNTYLVMAGGGSGDAIIIGGDDFQHEFGDK